MDIIRDGVSRPWPRKLSRGRCVADMVGWEEKGEKVERRRTSPSSLFFLRSFRFASSSAMRASDWMSDSRVYGQKTGPSSSSSLLSLSGSRRSLLRCCWWPIFPILLSPGSPQRPPLEGRPGSYSRLTEQRWRRRRRADRWWARMGHCAATPLRASSSIRWSNTRPLFSKHFTFGLPIHPVMNEALTSVLILITISRLHIASQICISSTYKYDIKRRRNETWVAEISSSIL